MKKTLIFLFMIVANISLLIGEEETAFEKIDVDAISKTLGHLIVRHLDNPGIDFNIEQMVQGIKDEKAGNPSPMSEEEYEQTIALVQEKIFLKTAENNLEEANLFLEKNAHENDIVSLNEKLQYRISHEGTGEAVNSDSTPLIHYTGKLLDGTVFSTSHENEKPVPLPIKQTIAGFSKGLMGMKEGEKRELYIHPDLAFGVEGHLPPNSLLIFEVEIVKIDSEKEQLASES